MAPLTISRPFSASTAAYHQVQRRHPLDAEMTRHLFVLEYLAGVLAIAGRTVRLRWLMDTPWLASSPEKFQRFIEPAKLLPLVVPQDVHPLPDGEMRS